MAVLSGRLESRLLAGLAAPQTVASIMRVHMSAAATNTFGSPALKLRLPACDHGVGDLITSPQSPKLIDGVRPAPVPLWPDDRGYFMEILRVGHGLAAGFDPATTQVSSA